MRAGAAECAHLSGRSVRLSRLARLDQFPFRFSTRQRGFVFSRCYRAPARPHFKQRPSPLVKSSHLSPPTVPDSLFPGATAWTARNWNVQRPGSLRFVLAHAAHKPDPAITVLRRPTGMLCYVQVVSAPAADTPGACLMLHFDNRRYLFGRMAEGTQRNMVQRKLSLAKIQDLFLTGTVDWDHTGGLLGMILTIADLKASSAADQEAHLEKLRSKGKAARNPLAHLNIHGGKNLVHLLATARRFILRRALPVRPRELRHDPRPAGGPNEPDYTDENIRVWSIPLAARPPAAPAPARSPDGHSPKRRKLSPPPDAEPAAEDRLSAEEADQNIREGVVRDMFSSSWNLDTLREMRLADVELPAKIFVRNDRGHIEPYDGPPASEAPDTRVLVRLPWPASRIEQLPATEPSRQSMCYIVKCHPRRGKFDPEAATRLGVDKRDYRKLTAGKTAPGKDGAVVTPDMVIGPTIEGHGFAVVDLPSAALADELLARREWSDPDVMSGIDTMYWILSEGVTLEDPRLRQFVQDRPSIRHVVLAAAVCPNVPALESVAAQLIKMNRIDGDRFGLPVFDTKPPSAIPEDLRPLAEAGRVGLKFQLAPKPAFQTDTVVPAMDTARPVWELATRTPQVLALAETARADAADPDFLAGVAKAQRDLPSPDTEIVPLGTGSAIPSKYRNVSATLVRVPGWGSYLLDCGENTLGQLRRCFGHGGADDVLRDLRGIYISHAHADHHLGTISVVSRWRRVADPAAKLAIIATPKYQDFVRECHQVQDLSPHRLVPVTLRAAAGRPAPGTLARPVLFPDADTAACPLPRIEACYVDHCFEATAAVFTFPDTGLKVAYSGDCRPSAALADLARDAHLLIHECTFEDELAGDALAKKHSTLSEALDVARRARARRVLLTHFSQRYPKLPVVDEDRLRADEAGDGVDVLFAFDHMRVRLGEFKQAKMFLPALRELLKEEAKVVEDEGEV